MPALWRRAIARRERPPRAVGIEAKSCAEFRAEAVPLLIIDLPGRGNLPPLAATIKCLAESNKSSRRGKATNKRVCVQSPLESIRPRWNKAGAITGDIKVMPTILFSWLMLCVVVGVAAATRGRNPAWLLALVTSPLLAALLLLALPNLRTERQGRASIQAVIGWCRYRNSKGAARKSAFAAGTLTADRIDYWIRRRVLQYWDGVHPSQLLLSPGRDRRVGLSAIGHDRYREGMDASADAAKSALRTRARRTAP